MGVLIVVLLLLAAAFGVLGAVLKAIVFLVVTAILGSILAGALLWWGISRKLRTIQAEYDRQLTEQRVIRYRVNEAQRDVERLPPSRDDRY